MNIWYEENKDKLITDKEDLPPKRMVIRVDPETEKIFGLFMQDAINKLLDTLK